MPWLSAKQERFGHANPEKFGGVAKLAEWDKSTDFSKLPEKKDVPMESSKPPKMWLRGAVKDDSHPVVRAAQRKGISTEQEARHESTSSNPHIRSRGALGLRFIQGHGKP